MLCLAMKQTYTKAEEITANQPPYNCGEEIPMTMQVAMVGSDGIVLASDTYCQETPQLDVGQMYFGGRHGTNHTKIKIDHSLGMAISYGWDAKSAEKIGDLIVEHWRNEDRKNPEDALERICDKVPQPDRRRAQCLVVFTRPSPQMFFIQTTSNEDNKWEPWCRSSTSILIAGDTTNSTIFWAERYYRKFAPLHLSGERLIPLAAHMIGQAKTLNTAGIDGLEIVICSSSGIKQLSKDSCELLKRQAEHWDDTIGDLFLNHKPQYIYDVTR